MDPLEGEELLSGLTEFDFQLWRSHKDVPGSWTGMTRSCKSSITVNGYVRRCKVQEAHQLRSSSRGSTSQLLRMSLGTSSIPCYASYSCILHECHHQ